MRARKRRRRNLPLTVKLGRRRHTWRALVKKYGVKGARKHWRGKKKFHGYTKRRIAANRRRRRRNSWRGNRKGHRLAALRGWRKRGRRKARRGKRKARRGKRKARRSSRRGRRQPRTWKACVRRYGVKKAAKVWRKRKKRCGRKRRRSKSR